MHDAKSLGGQHECVLLVQCCKVLRMIAVGACDTEAGGAVDKGSNEKSENRIG